MEMRIRPSHALRPQAAAGGGAAGVQGFRLPASQARAPAAALTSAGATALVGAMLSARDQVAQRRGRALLGGLASLQRELLGGAPDAAAMQRLAGLLEGENGEDPALAEAMAAVALRARIELLRRGVTRGI